MDFTFDTFRPHLNTKFVLPFQDIDDWELTLTEVTKLPEHEESPRPPFSLIFHAPNKEQYLNQNTYVLKHDALGDVAIFLTAVGPTDTGMNYEAIFG